MLKLSIPEVELFDEAKNEFFIIPAYSLELEHSLISVSRWESKWCLPFLVDKDKTHQQEIDYIRCMTLTRNVDFNSYNFIPAFIIEQISTYIKAPMTATTFRKDDKRVLNREIITSEVIYYWMVTLNIPFECEKWHLNRLLTLINVCNIKNQPKKKTNAADLARRNAALNEARKSALNSTG